MIEVIKHGQTKFKATCTNCGCEFTYELSDMKPLGGIDCPDCGNHVVHQGFGNNNGGLYYPPNCRDISEVYGNEIKNCDYVVNAGVSWDNLNPLYTSSSKEAAIDMARHLPIECVEVAYSPCDNWNVDEIVWSNRR